MLDTLCFFFSFSPPNKIGDRFICRTLKQKLYDKALTIGLQGYAQLYVHQELPRFWVCKMGWEEIFPFYCFEKIRFQL